jgi:hypothetical protein
MGGILLWVSGGSWSWHIRYAGGNALPIGVMFLLWLCVYGLTGVLIAFLVLSAGCLCQRSTRMLPVLTAGAYIFMLCWYAVYFCTPLGLFSALLLLFSIVLLGIVFVLLKRSLLTAKILIIVIEAVQIRCLWQSFWVDLLI